nr:hypothetical protein [Tanacetum cinerariifolium]
PQNWCPGRAGAARAAAATAPPETTGLRCAELFAPRQTTGRGRCRHTPAPRAPPQAAPGAGWPPATLQRQFGRRPGCAPARGQPIPARGWCRARPAPTRAAALFPIPGRHPARCAIPACSPSHP